MNKPPFRSRVPTGARETAEAAFKSLTTKPVPAAVAEKPKVPGARELVTLRIDQEVLEHFQAEGPGWQDRINAVLRKAIGK